jgi:hypothetical protein
LKEEKKKKKKEKDPDALKRPLSAYMLYNNYRRPMLRELDSSKYKHKELRIKITPVSFPKFVY